MRKIIAIPQGMGYFICNTLLEPERLSMNFNCRFRDELLNGELFTSLTEAKVVTEDHRLEYNHRRLHSSLVYRTTAEFAAQCRAGVAQPIRLMTQTEILIFVCFSGR